MPHNSPLAELRLSCAEGTYILIEPVIEAARQNYTCDTPYVELPAIASRATPPQALL